MLFKIEAAVRLGYTHQTCTDVPCKWNACFTQRVQPAKIADIRFYKRDPVRRGKTRHPPPPSTSDEQASFVSDLASGDFSCVCLSTFTEHNERFETAAPRPTTKLPAPLRTLFREENRSLSSEALEQLCADTSRQLAVTKSEADLIEECTRNQASSAAWHEQRSGRITASVAHAAMHTDPRSPSRSVLQRICGPPVGELRVPAVLWGKQHEHDAQELYNYTHGEQTHLRISPVGEMTEPTLHDTTFVSKSGLVVSTERPFLGASPDGIIQCSCCGKGVLEIKCPFVLKEAHISTVLGTRAFCLDSDCRLRTDHVYYAQVQLQMYVCNVPYADFVVWSPIDCVVTRVLRDDVYISDMVVKLASLWETGVLPELLCRSLEVEVAANEPGSDGERVFCVCRTSSNLDNMVGCDRCDNWFHPTCLKLKRLPRCKTWYCPACRKLVKK